MRLGLRPLANAVAVAIEKRPQSFVPDCCGHPAILMHKFPNSKFIISTVSLSTEEYRESNTFTSLPPHPTVETTIQWLPLVCIICITSLVQGKGALNLINSKVEYNPCILLNWAFKIKVYMHICKLRSCCECYFISFY